MRILLKFFIACFLFHVILQFLVSIIKIKQTFLLKKTLNDEANNDDQPVGTRNDVLMNYSLFNLRRNEGIKQTKGERKVCARQGGGEQVSGEIKWLKF